MRHLGTPLGVVLVLGACSVINKFEEVKPEAVGGESNGGSSDTGGRGGSTMNGGTSGSSGTSGDGGAPPEGGTSGTAGDGGEGDTGGTTNTGGTDTGGTSGTGGCTTMTTYYRDADEDTYGDNDASQEACEPPTGYVEQRGDCDDGNSAINPGATELCNGLDENCNDPDEGDTCPAGCVPEIVAQRLHLLCRGPETWGGARDTCTSERMILARIRDSAESVAVRNAMMTTANVTQYWLGGSDGVTEGTWRWLVGGDVFYPNTALYNNWALNEPASAFDIQDCLQVQNGQWYAQECQLTSAYVCEEAP
jgi:hypothetical protein